MCSDTDKPWGHCAMWNETSIVVCHLCARTSKSHIRRMMAARGGGGKMASVGRTPSPSTFWLLSLRPLHSDYQRCLSRHPSQSKDPVVKLPLLCARFGFLSERSPCSQAQASTVHWPTAASAPGSFREMQNLGSHRDLPSRNLRFNKNPGDSCAR